MVTTPFSDAIVNPSELRRNQAHWLGIAATEPVTVAYGSHKLTILNRERIANLYKGNYYLELAMKICVDTSGAGKYETPPWLKQLTSQEKIEFTNELVEGISEAMLTNKWHKVDAILEDWKATAETLDNQEAMSALTVKDHSKTKYFPLR